MVLAGVRPQEWLDARPNADESQVTCYNYAGRELARCEWVGRYQEYLVFFKTRLVPNYMSVGDMQHVVRAIDARMAQYLGGTPVSPEP